MEKEMQMPQYYGLVKTVAQVGAVLGVIAGIVAVLGGFAAFQYGAVAGVTAIFGGVVTIVMSIVGLGVMYCFLAIVRAQVETRNAVVKYTSESV
ncbi:MAG: hypothetical protein ACWA44_06260 [Thiotrichales bacterium]